VAPLYIEPRSPWENGYIESFNGKMREQFLDGGLFYTVKEAQILTDADGGITTRSARTAVSGASHPLPKPSACELRTYMMDGTKLPVGHG
jgi:hypothetical protein